MIYDQVKARAWRWALCVLVAMALLAIGYAAGFHVASRQIERFEVQAVDYVLHLEPGESVDISGSGLEIIVYPAEVGE